MQLQEAIKEAFYNFFLFGYLKEIVKIFAIPIIFMFFIKDGFKYAINTLRNR